MVKKGPQNQENGLNKTMIMQEKTALKAYEYHWVYRF